MTLAVTLVRHKSVLAILAALTLSLVLAPAMVQGSSTGTDERTDFGIGDDSEFRRETQLGGEPLESTVASIINVALSLLGIVAVVIILMGGFIWMTAGGNDEKTAQARKLIFAGIIGLAIILSAFAIARFVLGSLSQATGTGDATAFE